MNPETFSPNAPGQLIRSLQGYWTYEPAPLPTDYGVLHLDFSLAPILTEAARAIGELNGLGRTLPNPHLLIRPFINREAVSSSRIEGTITQLDQLFLFEAEPDQIHHQADVEEVRNYVLAAEYGLKEIQEGKPLTLRLIREVHGFLMQGVRGGDKRPGEFRNCDVRIAKQHESWDQSRFIPPTHQRLNDLLRDLERFLNTDHHWPVVIDLALAHYQFETIHPFMDGNGRVGRLLFMLILCQRGHLTQPLLYLSDYLERHNEEYRDHLLSISQRGTWVEWIRFLAQGIIEQANDAATRSKKLLDLRQNYRDKLSTSKSSAPLLLLDLVFQQPFLTIPRAAKFLAKTYITGQKSVEQLVKAGILTLKGGSSTPKIYVAAEILRLIDEPTSSPS